LIEIDTLLFISIHNISVSDFIDSVILVAFTLHFHCRQVTLAFLQLDFIGVKISITFTNASRLSTIPDNVVLPFTGFYRFEIFAVMW
jgi:hypothetical protein